MSKSFLHTSLYAFIILILFSTLILSFKEAGNKTGILKISFVNTANGKNIALRDSLYKNDFGEVYSISKLKYYISNFSVPGANLVFENDPYHLINAAEDNNGFELSLSPGNYKTVAFLIGIDSAMNCSGAQTGALDPMNDMFWTWNSGYVMFKLEGNSTSSTADLQRIEEHIGGYKGEYNVITNINLNIPGSQLLHIEEGHTTELVIEANMDHLWKGNADIKISETPVCMSVGPLAKRIASNFNGLFSVRSIK